MTFEVTGLGEHLAALGAFVRPDARVFPGVAVHVSTRFKAFITLFALIWPFRTMRLFVDLDIDEKNSCEQKYFNVLGQIHISKFSPQIYRNILKL